MFGIIFAASMIVGLIAVATSVGIGIYEKVGDIKIRMEAKRNNREK